MGHEQPSQAFSPEIGVHREVMNVEEGTGPKSGKPFEGDENAGGNLPLKGEKEMSAGPLAKLGDEAFTGRGRESLAAPHDIAGVGFEEGENRFTIGF